MDRFAHQTLAKLGDSVIVAEGIVRPDLRSLVIEHFDEMVAMSAPESSQALDLEALADPAITVFTIRSQGQLLGCGALKELSPVVGELKTMRTVASARGLGIGGTVLDHLLTEAGLRGYAKVCLETGSEDFFAPARSMYRSRGFQECDAFDAYLPDPHSVFMVVELPN